MIKRDIDCGHGVQYRTLSDPNTGDQTEYCVKCANDRIWAMWKEQMAQKRAYMELREPIGIISLPGLKVVLWCPFNGYDSDKQQVERLGMKLGQVFTVEESVAGSSSSWISLDEFPGERFNTVQFCVAKREDMLRVLFGWRNV